MITAHDIWRVYKVNKDRELSNEEILQACLIEAGYGGSCIDIWLEMSRARDFAELGFRMSRDPDIEPVELDEGEMCFVFRISWDLGDR